jgi:hypothetical protein
MCRDCEGISWRPVVIDGVRRLERCAVQEAARRRKPDRGLRRTNLRSIVERTPPQPAVRRGAGLQAEA